MAPNTSTKYDLDKFDGSNDFSLWRMKMRVVMIQQGLLKALKGNQGLSETMSADEKEDMLERAHNALDWFATYRLFDGGKVLMKNNVACKVVGIGIIQIKMHDGIVKTLTDVKHVLELRKNLILREQHGLKRRRHNVESTSRCGRFGRRYQRDGHVPAATVAMETIVATTSYGGDGPDCHSSRWWLRLQKTHGRCIPGWRCRLGLVRRSGGGALGADLDERLIAIAQAVMEGLSR
ncbi:hypothetical protein RJ640_016681 [Escallonia rubra]|uniref:Retrovirus-related Pol polyprotein from transposon TNT 1-94-like beta-barrel domain-containing protein n=1 Tax=Escallonia rubra TaxID=112253 RepID=A0AA88USD6_9ASTE|nr:hypothetical protein RJ640_016681 [Escallonia rubra]